ncbi:MAG: phosphoenolpyruvate--protein phosphotransferase [Deltaproteobacteria bacterium]|nr:phosphoenolpyruvate--protein phosphotransferase [Deltaproteobacteria bacterium]
MKIKTRIHSPSSQNVISEIVELGDLCHREEDVRKILDLLTEKIARIMAAEVCSIYLLDPPTRELVLTATKGLNPQSVGRVRLKLGEGLVGKTLEWLKPVSMAVGRRSKTFKFVPGTGEEQFSSFLAVPLIYNRNPVGVLVIQNEKPVRYSPRSVHLLLTLAIPAVSVIEKAKMIGSLGQIHETPAVSHLQRRLEGVTHQAIGASPGIAIAPVHIIDRKIVRPPIAASREAIHVDVEKMRVLEAFRWVEEEILETQKKAQKKFGMEELSIFDAYKMVLESEPFKEQILQEIDGGKSALQAVVTVISRYAEELSRGEDDYIRERIYDIEDLGRKITDRILYGSEVPKNPHVLQAPAILLSEFWSISDFVDLDLEKTKGILAPSGGASSHIAILAKSLGVPAVMGLSSFAERIHENDLVILDGSQGILVVNPSPPEREAYEKEIEEEAAYRKKYRQSAKNPAVMKGGRRVVVGANMEMTGHMARAFENGAEEIGLFRTEMPFLMSKSLPTEEEQMKLYSKILTNAGKREVTIRTLDIGGDKYLPYLSLPHEANPFLGWRSIRISLEREDLFRIQLRALLRASASGKMRLLFPMISSLEEFRRVKEIIDDIKKELTGSGTPFAKKIPLGVMIEVPAAVLIADALAREADFFSLGTNDLTQYMLAVDRNNAKVAELYNPLHPSVLRAIDLTVKAAHAAGIPATVCGEMAGSPQAVLLLSGMGVDGFSLSAPLVSKIKNFICRLSYADARLIARKALSSDSAVTIASELHKFFKAKGLEEFLPHAALVV